MQNYGKNDEEQRRYLYPDSDYPNSLPSVTPLVGPRRIRCRSRWTHQRVMSPSRNHCRFMASMNWMTCRIVEPDPEMEKPGDHQPAEPSAIGDRSNCRQAIPWAVEPFNA